MLVDRVGLSGELGLVTDDVLSLDHDTVCWHLHAHLKLEDVTDDQLRRVYGDCMVASSEDCNLLDL